MGLLETVYDSSPIFFQNIMCSVAGARNYWVRYTGVYAETRRFCRDFDSWPVEKQREYQRQELTRFIQFANTNSRFYRNLYRGIDLSALQSIEDLKKLPIVDKEMLRSNIEDAYAIPERGSEHSNTGGTTGKSLTVRSTRTDEQIRMAVLDHFKSRIGFENLKMKQATFNGKHIIPPGQKKHVYWRYNAPCRQMIYSSFHLTEDKIGYYVESLNKYKPQSINGFFTAICDVASYIDRHNLKLEFVPIAIFPTSETVNDEGRRLIERVFQCKVYDQYASSENAPFVAECKNQKLHMEMNTGVIEAQENGEVLVTSFTSHGTPLIRYAIGDKMDFAEPSVSCDCGLHGPIINKIQGRRLDFLYKADGAKINAGNVSNLLKYLPNSVIRSQFRQDRMDEIEILLEVDQARFREESKKDILKECEHTFGKETKVKIRVVDEIPRAASGKYRFIVNTAGV